MEDVVIVEAVRSPFGRRGGVLSAMHPADLLGSVLRTCLDRANVDPAVVGQVVGGCVEQVGEQASNVVRSAWLGAGLPESVAAVSLDSACGSSQQAVGLAAALIRSGTVDVALACGLASMSRLPIAASHQVAFETPPTRRMATVDYAEAFMKQMDEYGMGQFGCAERLAAMYDITRADADEFGYRSHERAQVAWEQGRFEREVVPIDAPVVGADGAIEEAPLTVTKDEGLRETSLEKLGTLNPITGPKGVHTAGTTSQISDGASAVLMMTRSRAIELGVHPRARIVDHCHVGVDPVLMLSGPLEATSQLLKRNGISLGSIDLYEINEAFAAVPLMWAKVFGADSERLNPNGGGISIGHPVGATGARLIATALNELERTDGSTALISMCAGGGLGTGTLLERI
jgi:acetyl-CoA C-acetyltransferase